MPLLPTSDYHPPCYVRHPHLQSIWPALFRPRACIPAQRSELTTHDGDTILVDRMFAAGFGDGACPPQGMAGAGCRSYCGQGPKSGSERATGPMAAASPAEQTASTGMSSAQRPPRQADGVVVISHGLEGDSRRRYVLGMASALLADGWDIAARNFRGCGGQMNRKLPMYHSGETQDLHTVVMQCVAWGYRRIALVGFSMGGNQTLKYLGEDATRVPRQVVGAVAFSVPCDLVGSAAVLDRPSNRIYMEYFLRSLRRKMRAKAELFPGRLQLDGLDAMRTFAEFDGQFTAPLHGFASAMDYWQQCGCGQFLEGVRVPTLLVNAQDDPFLSRSCFPRAEAAVSEHLFLEMPRWGGHVGFMQPGSNNRYWSDARAVAFLHPLQA